ncbi:MAG: hypothetical protein WAU07_00555 [Microgenomates group bacterium]
MENRENSAEQLTNSEVTPNLLELKVVAENSESKSDRVIVYCLPILGSSIVGESLKSLSQKARAIYVVEVLKYGYPNFDQYVQQTKQRLEQLTGYNPENLVFVGFSEGASLAARMGQAFNLPKKNVYLLAPITSFRPSRARLSAWRAQGRSKIDSNQRSDLKQYLKAFLSSQSRIYSPSDTVSRIDQIKALNLSRKQWGSNPDDLTRGIVVTGNRDYISPPGDHTTININATHVLNDYMVFLNEAM